MIIARDIRKNNIAEYVLYMWQIEDIIRANRFDIEKIDDNIIQKFDQPEKNKKEIRSWYEELIKTMTKEGIRKKGHLKFVMEIINELNDLHKRLLNDPDKTKYNQKYKLAQPHIKNIKKKADLLTDNEIEICFNGLYFLLLMRYEKMEITPSTQTAFTSFSKLLANLAAVYKKTEEGRKI